MLIYGEDSTEGGRKINQEMIWKLLQGVEWERELTWHHWTVKKFLPLFIPYFYRHPVICFHANRDTNCKGWRKKGVRGKKVRIAQLQSKPLKAYSLGWEEGEGGWWRWCRGNCWGRKAAAWYGSGSLQTEERPFPLPFSLSLSLFIHPPLVYLMQRRRNRIHFIMASLTKKNPQCRFLRRLTSLCQNAATRRSSVDKLPPSASFFKTAASSSNTYALTQSPHALLSDNKNNRWAPGMRDGATEGEGTWVEEWMVGVWGGGRWRKQVAENIASFSFWLTGWDSLPMKKPLCTEG